MIKAVSALRLAVTDVDRSVAFYKKLGFLEVAGEGPAREVRSNWFRIRFEKRGTAGGSGGLRICVSVEDVEEYAAQLKRQRVASSVETVGNRHELLIADPDGYSLLFFATKGVAQKSEASHRPA